MCRTLSLLAVALVAGCSSSAHRDAVVMSSTKAPVQQTVVAPARTTAPRTSPAPVSSTAPTKSRITKVLVIIEENHSLDEMRAGMPYLYGVAQHYGYATNYRAITHPSLPNYLAVAGGSTFGVTDDENPSGHVLHGPSVFGQTLSKGGTARLYAEALPAGAQACPRTSTGVFAVRHTPWAYFVDERAACRTGTVAAGTPTSGRLAQDIEGARLPTTGMLIPDLAHDAHDGTLAEADSWLKSWLPRLTAGPDFTSGRLAIVITADEDDYTRVNKVMTVVLAKRLSRHVVTAPLTHYSLTRFLDDVAGAKPLRLAAKARSLGTAFGLRP